MVYVIPVLIILVLISALKKGVPCYTTFISGVEEGFKTIISILPSLVAILSVSAMLRASGLIDAVSKILAPICNALDIPAEILPLALIRPMSGGGSIALLSDMLSSYGTGSRIALAACILSASTETTFYTVSVYFGATGVKYTKRVILAAVFGDLVGILCACALSAINF